MTQNTDWKVAFYAPAATPQEMQAKAVDFGLMGQVFPKGAVRAPIEETREVVYSEPERI